MAPHSEGTSLNNPINAAAGDFYSELVEANERSVDSLLRDLAAEQSQPNIRRLGANLEVLAAGFCALESPRYKSATLVEPLQNVSQRFCRRSTKMARSIRVLSTRHLIPPLFWKPLV